MSESSIERGGVRVARKAADDGDRVTCSIPGANGALGLTLHTAHELLDCLAIVLNRPDLVVAHRYQLAKRQQPGMPPIPAPATPRPPAQKEEHRNYDH